MYVMCWEVCVCLSGDGKCLSGDGKCLLGDVKCL